MPNLNRTLLLQIRPQAYPTTPNYTNCTCNDYVMLDSFYITLSKLLVWMLLHHIKLIFVRQLITLNSLIILISVFISATH